MSTNFDVPGTVGIFGGGVSFKFNRSHFLLFGVPTTIRFVGFTASPTKLIVSFDRIPILTGPALLASNWIVTGVGVITVSSVSVVGQTIELLVTGTFDTSVYNLSVPSGVTSDSGIPADPFVYDGPFLLQFALGSVASGGSAFNNGFN